ncbi:glycosyltransferase [uncultured Psychromonas sp.]|uniref:glycosyltransferase n=1 Tax=uncultured Psychromonas sp. TaxID=173974 RepID=UPI00260BAF2D|nr:glycosyltransferase [uncultured Psychromonas sp.]
MNLIIGNFGYVNNQLDGQTVRTRVLYESFSTLESVDYFDVNGKNPFFAFFAIAFHLFKVENVYFVPGKKMLLFVSPLLIFYNVFTGHKIHLFTVGGWIGTLVSKNIYVKKIMKCFTTVNVELESIKKMLLSDSINSNVLFNFRDFHFDIDKRFNNKGPVKLVYFSRVMEEKGVFKAINVACALEKLLPGRYTLDIYGTLCFRDTPQIDKFNKLIHSNNHVRFLGALEPFEIVNQLSKYHVMLFPTSYSGEGFPGCIVDAKFSALMVICTDWNFNSEVVKDKSDGFIFDVNKYVSETIKLLAEIENSDIEIYRTKSYFSSVNFTKNAFDTWYQANIK